MLMMFVLSMTMQGQSVYTLLRSTDSDTNSKGYSIVKEEKVFSSSNTKKKSVYYYNPSQQLLKEDRFSSDDVLEARLSFDYKDGLKTGRRFDQKILGKWQSERNSYHYDINQNLVKIIYYKADSTVLKYADISNNSQGDPVEMRLYEMDFLVGVEKAIYNYASNSVEIHVFDKEGKSLSTSTIKIKEVLDVKSIQDNGNTFAYKRNWNEQDELYYLTEYKFDSNGNWISKKIFLAEMKDEKLKKIKRDRVFKRKITYL